MTYAQIKEMDDMNLNETSEPKTEPKKQTPVERLVSSAYDALAIQGLCRAIADPMAFTEERRKYMSRIENIQDDIRNAIREVERDKNNVKNDVIIEGYEMMSSPMITITQDHWRFLFLELVDRVKGQIPNHEVKILLYFAELAAPHVERVQIEALGNYDERRTS